MACTVRIDLERLSKEDPLISFPRLLREKRLQERAAKASPNEEERHDKEEENSTANDNEADNNTPINGDTEGNAKEKKPKKKRREQREEYYDIDDPFIDDTEMPDAGAGGTFLAILDQMASDDEADLLLDDPDASAANFYVYCGDLPEREEQPVRSSSKSSSKKKKSSASSKKSNGGKAKSKVKKTSDKATEKGKKTDKKNHSKTLVQKLSENPVFTAESSIEAFESQIVTTPNKDIPLSEDKGTPMETPTEKAADVEITTPVNKETDLPVKASPCKESPKEDVGKTPKRNRELENLVRAYAEAFDFLSEVAGKIKFPDSVSFVSSLRPPFMRLFLAAVRFSSSLANPPSDQDFFRDVSRILPFSKGSLEKLLVKQLVPEFLSSSEDRLEQLYADFRAGYTEEWSGKQKNLLFDLIHLEEECAYAQHWLIGNDLNVKTYRKDIYCRIIECLKPVASLDRALLSKQYSAAKRRKR